MLKKKIKNIIRITCILAFLSITPAYAQSHIHSHIPNAQKIGQGRMSVMFWNIYDAALYAPESTWQEDKPFALQLSYLKQFKGKKIADRSIVEIRGQGFTDEVKLATWHTQMRQIFPDVNEGVRLTGIKTKTGETIFYKNDTKIGTIKDPAFSTAFFNIWLSDKTSAPNLRRKLLGTS